MFRSWCNLAVPRHLRMCASLFFHSAKYFLPIDNCLASARLQTKYVACHMICLFLHSSTYAIVASLKSDVPLTAVFDTSDCIRLMAFSSRACFLCTAHDNHSNRIDVFHMSKRVHLKIIIEHTPANTLVANGLSTDFVFNI